MGLQHLLQNQIKAQNDEPLLALQIQLSNSFASAYLACEVHDLRTNMLIGQEGA